jgi:hypothetical protein
MVKYNNYDYVLYISHVISMLLRLLRGRVLHHSIEKKMERKPLTKYHNAETAPNSNGNPI